MKHNIIVNISVKGQIRLRVSYNSKRIDVSTGISYPADKFKNGRAKPGTRNDNRQTAAEVNSKLAAMQQRIDNYFTECELNNRMPDAEHIRNVVRVRSLSANKTFAEIYETYLRDYDKSKSLSYNRRKCFGWLLHIVKDRYGENLLMQDITESWVIEFKQYLKNTYKTTSVQLLQVTLEMFLKHCNKNHYTDIVIKNTKVRLLKVKEEARVYLDEDELEQFTNCVLTMRGQEYIRDVFLFCCWTGLRISDAWALKKSEISERRLSVVTIKTRKQIYVDLNSHSQAIIDKYYRMFPETETLFPKAISNCSYTHSLRVICKIAGLDSPVTLTYYMGDTRIEDTAPKYQVMSSHAARRTFVVTCLTRNIQPLVIIQWTGHASIKALEPYIAIVNKMRQNEMLKLDN